MKLDWRVLEIDAEAEVARITAQLRDSVATRLRRRGAVVAVSGGIDSAVCVALAVRAFGPERVLALLLPERESSRESVLRATDLAGHLSLDPLVQDLTPVLDAVGCYRLRDEAVRRALPEYAEGWRMKIVVAGGIEGRITHFRLVAEAPGGEIKEARLGVREYLQIVAATSFKQRTRKTLEYYHADRMHYAVVGTANRLEFDQGFFVKNGDGSADIKPIAHLYKSQVYALAEYLQLPSDILSALPTADTYSLPQSQEEFYFALPYRQMDLALWAFDHAVAVHDVAVTLGISDARARQVYADIQAKRRGTAYLHMSPILLGEVKILGDAD
jgi:NAD+ synthase